MVMKNNSTNQSGQAIVEYILLISIVVGLFLIVSRGLNQGNLAVVITKPIKEDYAKVYKYGHPKASGVDDPEGPARHPRFEGSNSFRLYINPI